MDINKSLETLASSHADKIKKDLLSKKQDVAEFSIGDIAFIPEDGGRRVKIRSIVDKNNKVVVELFGSSDNRRTAKIDASGVFKDKKGAEKEWKRIVSVVKNGVKIPSRSSCEIDFFSAQLMVTEAEKLFSEDGKRSHHISVARVGDYLLYEYEDQFLLKKYSDPVQKFIEIKEELEEKKENKKISVFSMKKETKCSPLYLFQLGDSFVDYLSFVSAGGVI